MFTEKDPLVLERDSFYVQTIPLHPVIASVIRHIAWTMRKANPARFLEEKCALQVVHCVISLGWIISFIGNFRDLTSVLGVHESSLSLIYFQYHVPTKSDALKHRIEKMGLEENRCYRKRVKIMFGNVLLELMVR